MIIKNIELENIRSHKNSSIDFSKGITVFTGRTGCGKSTILMALEYGLFGSESNVSNNAILRRDSQKGKIKIDFEERGDNYTITRGLKKQGKNIVVDNSILGIERNGVALPLLGRASDINQKLLEIINYPEDIKPKALFETTSYTRQDEIRELIQMSTEKRQEHIDKILQLSKYKSTWENMKEVISFFTREISEKMIRLERLEELQEELLKLEKKIIETESIFDSNNKELFSKKQKHKEQLAIIKEKEFEIKDMLEKRRELDNLNGTISRLNTDISAVKMIISAFEERISEFKKNISEIGETREFDSLQMKNIELLKEIELKNRELQKTQKEFENIKTLGEGKCPACMQQVTPDHIENLNQEFDNIKNKIQNEIKILKETQQNLEPEMRKSKLYSELKKDLDTNLEKQKEKIIDITHKEKELKEKQEKVELIKINVEELNLKENDFKALKEKEKELFSSIESIETVNRTLGKELEYFKVEFKEKIEVIEELEKSKESLRKLETGIEILSRLREDIRNIREIIRRNFLEDFRQEFQRKFEEIRKYEEDYTVDIKQDYEPVAYTSTGEEVPIVNLSGGEKTSVALSYRLALADLAAQISSINPSEILILDEPTTGFDQDDIKALPSALRNIKTIPQIIIVTHEEELKNAADYKFEIQKESSISSIKEAN